MKKQIAVLVSALLMGGGTYAQNGAQAQKPKAYMVSDAHLDTQWNWDIQTTIKDYVWNTISQNLFLLKQYPEYIFNFEGAVKYAWMKEYYPAQYEEMKKFIESGRWHISGASWDATDTLVPSIESAIRNIMLGQDYYRKEFGVESTDIFLPDCFGFGWTLPAIASHCGLIGFSSQKLQWRNKPFYGNDKYPFTVGLWQGIDGSTIMMTHGYDYNQRFEDGDLSENKDLLELTGHSPLHMVYRYYGTGDIGGSPTLESVRAVEKGLQGNGPLQIVSATSDRIYKDFQPYASHPELPKFNGELLMDVHGTGCYTSQAAMKLYNRQNELLGDAAERSSVVAEWLNQASYPGAALTENWQRFIFHQFHDDLTGTSIPRAYEFSWNDELISLKQFSGILTSSIDAVARKMDTRVKGIPVVLYNALGFQVADMAEVELALPKKPKGITVYDMNGRKVAAQLLSYADGKARLLIEAIVPATGYAVYDVRTSGPSADTRVSVDSNALENSIYKITLDTKGDIVSLFDKKNGKELVKPGKSIRLALFTQNKSYMWPAWEILKETIDREPVSITEDVKMTLVEDGELRKSLCIEKRYGESLFKQYIRLYEGSRADRIDFYNEVDWQLSNALLKAEFPLNMANTEATYDLGLGSVRRGNNTETAYEVYAQYWADLTDRSGNYGISVLNDSKYGWDKPADNTLRLTLLHTPSTEKRYAHQRTLDHGVHHYTYSIVGHTGARTEDALVAGEALNMPLVAFVAPKHAGHLGRTFSMLATSTPQIGVRALKAAEDGDGYIVRCYETTGNPVEGARITFPAAIVSAEECNGIEERIGDAAFEGRSLVVSAGKFAPKTYRVRLAEPAVRSTLAIDNAPVKLDYDITAYTTDEFFTYYTIDKALGSFAAELIPATVECDGVTFAMGEANTDDAVLCNGQTYTKLYVLASAVEEPRTAEFRVGDRTYEAEVPLWKGFYGQWGWYGNSEGFMQRAKIGYLGTHRHQTDLGNVPYGFSYMYLLTFDIPEGATTVTLPRDKKVLVYAMTASNNPIDDVKLASRTFVRPDER